MIRSHFCSQFKQFSQKQLEAMSQMFEEAPEPDTEFQQSQVNQVITENQFIEDSQDIEDDSQMLQGIAFEAVKKQEVKKPKVKKRKAKSKARHLYISPEEELEDMSSNEMAEFEDHLRAGRASKLTKTELTKTELTKQ